MPPDCTVALNLTFTSKSGKYAGLNRHRIFLYDYSSQHQDMVWHFIGCISENPDIKGIRDRIILHFSIDFILGSTSSNARQR